MKQQVDALIFISSLIFSWKLSHEFTFEEFESLLIISLITVLIHNVPDVIM